MMGFIDCRLNITGTYKDCIVRDDPVRAKGGGKLKPERISRD